MISRYPVPACVLITLVLIMVSCSGGGDLNGAVDPPIQPDISATGISSDGNHNRHLWGYFSIYYNPDANTAEVIPIRNTSDHWNVLGWLEGGPCTNCVKVVGVTDSGHGTKLFDVEITHPFPSLNLTGFDVRGIAIFDSNYTFAVIDLLTADRSIGDGEVINADGYTTLYESTTEGSGPNGLQGYIGGNFSTAQAPNGVLNPFKRYVSDDPANTRNAFYAGESITATYDIDMPDGIFVFGYAVDASWTTPTIKPVTDPMADFPPEANCPEPWKIVVTEIPIGLGLTDAGGSSRLIVDIYDHQGKSSYKTPYFISNDLTCGPVEIPWIEDGAGFSRYGTTINVFDTISAGNYRCLIYVEDNENDTAPGWLNLTSYQQVILEISEYEHSGWAITWGGTDWDSGGRSVAADHSGNAYVVGSFQLTVDFDPGAGEFNLDSIGERDAYLARYDSDGNLVWVKSWGGTEIDSAADVEVDIYGYVYVTGSFRGTVDFDPGPDTFNLVSAGNSDGFMSKFDRDGEFIGAFRWGGVESDYGNGIIGNESTQFMYITGAIDRDIFLGRFYCDNGLMWSYTWGGPELDQGLAVTVDIPGNAYISGGYTDSFDFDPGAGTDVHTSNGSTDAFLCKFNPDGEFQWAKTWGGTGLDSAEDLEAHGIHTIVVVGRYDNTVNFNPGGVAYHTSNGSQDAFMSKFNEDGDFQWVKVWGGSGGWGEWEYADGVSIDNTMNIYVSGRFGATVDFDPDDAGVTELTANGQVDVFLAKFNFVGTFQWVRGWGGLYEDVGTEVYASDLNDIFITGYYYDTVDFDPGPDVEEHTSNGQRDIFLSKFTPDGEW